MSVPANNTAPHLTWQRWAGMAQHNSLSVNFLYFPTADCLTVVFEIMSNFKYYFFLFHFALLGSREHIFIIAGRNNTLEDSKKFVYISSSCLLSLNIIDVNTINCTGLAIWRQSIISLRVPMTLILLTSRIVRGFNLHNGVIGWWRWPFLYVNTRVSPADIKQIDTKCLSVCLSSPVVGRHEVVVEALQVCLTVVKVVLALLSSRGHSGHRHELLGQGPGWVSPGEHSQHPDRGGRGVPGALHRLGQTEIHPSDASTH